MIEIFSQRHSKTALLDINHIHSAVIDPNFTLEFSSAPENHYRTFRTYFYFSDIKRPVRWVVVTSLLRPTPPSTSVSSSPASSPSSSPPSSMPWLGLVVGWAPSSTPPLEGSLGNLNYLSLLQVINTSIDCPTQQSLIPIHSRLHIFYLDSDLPLAGSWTSLLCYHHIYQDRFWKVIF